MESLKEFGRGVWGLVYASKPFFLSRKPSFNFITYHYFWIIGNTLLASVILKSSGAKISYIDALFMGSGAATQSGLNTVDINLLSLGQQIVLYTIPMFTNPIFINGVLVLVRYILFQIRFKAVAAEALRRRRTLSRARGRDVTDEERGIDGRNIVVIHNETSPIGSANTNEVEMEALPKEVETGNENPPSSSSSGNALTSSSSDSEPDENPLKPQITFADQPKPGNGTLSIDTRPLFRAPAEQHIAFLERQRRASETVLRIPSPRDAEMGVAPRAVDESDLMTRVISRRPSIYSRMSANDRVSGDDIDTSELPPAPRRAITIAEPVRPTDIQSSSEDLPPARDTFGGASRIRRPDWIRRTSKTARETDANGAELQPIRSRIPTLGTITSYFNKSSNSDNLKPYLSWTPTIGRNSNFAYLTEEQREELGGIEYRTLKALILIILFYFWVGTVTGIIGLLPWIKSSARYGKVVNDAGIGRIWWAIYTSSSAFNDVGFTLTADSMISFSSAVWPLLLMSVLIIAGNTGFPIFLRIIIWVLSKIAPKGSGWDEEFQFLLDHPRRCFVLLFPSGATWALFWILVGLNGCDLLLYVILDLTNPVVSSVPARIRVLDGWFQAVSTRTAGFTVVDLSLLHPAVQVSYLIMMYISVLPIAISVRRTNVYEEQSLGVFEKQPGAGETEEGKDPSYLGSHLRAQLSFDLPYIALGFFLVTIVEGNRIGKDPRFSMFAVLFEIISAYGTVGLSLGYPGTNTSFSFKLKTLSKLIIICMQIRGRHRGLPYGLDMAVLLPSEKQQLREAEEAAQQIQRRRSTSSLAPSALHRTGTRGSDRGAAGRTFFSGLLHPGPPMPAAYRRPHRDDIQRAPTLTRQHSGTTTGMRRDSRDGQSNRGFFSSGFSVGAASGATESRPNQRHEGRRHFYQEGVNPLPTASGTSAEPHRQTEEGRQA